MSITFFNSFAHMAGFFTADFRQVNAVWGKSFILIQEQVWGMYSNLQIYSRNWEEISPDSL